MPAATPVPADPAPARRPEARRRHGAVALALLAALASAAAGLWLAFAPRAPSGPTLPVLMALALALVGPLGWVAAMVAHRRNAQAAAAEALRQRQRRRDATRDMLDLLPVALALCDPSSTRVSANRAMAHLLRLDGDASAPMVLDWQDRIAAADWPAWRRTCARAQQSGQAQWLRCGLRTADGEEPVLAQIAAVEGDDGPGLAISLTPREGEAGLAQEAVLQLRDLLGLAEAEKWQFGQAVHDELGQRLSGLAYFAKSLERKLQQAQRAEAEDAGWLTGLANESMAVARGLARGLVPVGSDDPAALTVALSDFCESTRRSYAIGCELRVDPGFDPGGAARANHLYHAVQELVTNACKHGRARHVQVALEVDDAGQQVVVRNDGRALGPVAPHAGMGLNGVRSRVAYLGGRFALVDEPTGGVRATIVLPSPAAPEARP